MVVDVYLAILYKLNSMLEVDLIHVCTNLWFSIDTILWTICKCVSEISKLSICSETYSKYHKTGAE